MSSNATISAIATGIDERGKFRCNTMGITVCPWEQVLNMVVSLSQTVEAGSNVKISNKSKIHPSMWFTETGKDPDGIICVGSGQNQHGDAISIFVRRDKQNQDKRGQYA